MAGNMESFLLGGDDDSSSGDSDAGGNGASGTATAPTAAMQSPPTAAAPPAAAPAPGPSPVADPSHRSSGQQQQSQSSGGPSELSQRLSQLYSPATNRTQQSTSQAAQGSPGHGSSSPRIIPAQQRPQTSQMAQQQQQPRTSHPAVSSRATSSSQMPPNRMASTRDDPFAPTPVSEIRERTAQKYNTQQPQPQLQQQQHGRQRQPTFPGRPAPVSGSSTHQQPMNAATATAAKNAQELEIRKQKQRFVKFTQHLIEYLKTRDPALNDRVRAVIKECTARNKRQNPGYESVTASMRTHLKAIVSENIWNHVETVIRQKEAMQQSTAPSASTAAPVSTSRASPPSNSQTKPPGSLSNAQSGNSVTSDADRERRQKEEFKTFLGILVKHLKTKDVQLYNRVNGIIRDCANRSERKEPGFESVTASVRARLKEVVSKKYLEEARQMTLRYRQQQRDRARAAQQQPQTQTGQLQTNTASGPDGASTKGRPASIAKRSGSSGMPSADQGGSGTSNRKQTAKAPPSGKSAGKTTGKAGGKSVGKSAGKRGTKGTSATTSTPAPVSTPTSQLKKSNVTSAQEEKAKDATAADVASNDAAVVREYSDLLEMVHHAVDFEWTKAGLSLGPDSVEQLSQEQHNLLESSTVSVISPLQVPVFPVPGWGERNVVSTRTAWARVRLREQRANTSASSATSSQEVPNMGQWRNEATAEARDPVLALISEGVQHYLRSVLEKGLHCARQRQNVDGIRLWHQQVTSADGATENPLSLRLGCDVSRQFAQEQGNAAMIIKRMEEALGRQSDVPRSDREMTMNAITEATSMTDLSLKPMLSSKSVVNAEHNGKRSFEVYGGKDAGEPPLGRVPKQARLMAEDLLVAQHIGAPNNRVNAAMLSSSAAFS